MLKLCPIVIVAERLLPAAQCAGEVGWREEDGKVFLACTQAVLFVALEAQREAGPAKEMETWPVCGAGSGRGTAADTLPFGPQPQPQAYVCGDDPATASTGSAHAGADAGSEDGATRRASKQVGAGRHTYTCN